MKDTEKNKNCRKAVIKFLACSLFGIIFFFVQISVHGQKRIPSDHVIALFKSIFNGWYVYLMIFLAGYAVIERIIKKRWKNSASDVFFFLQAILGLCLCIASACHLLPDSIMEIAASSINATGNILCAIVVTTIFIPLLTEYGLVDFFGVICSPFMRSVFHTPGSSAVIGVSAFLGNYSTGHVVARQMYERGRFTEKESVIVATGFSTCSIGLMINLVNYLHLMPAWNLYVLSVLIVTFTTTIICLRISPIVKKADTYMDGIIPEEEIISRERLIHQAFCEGVNRAANAPGLLQSIRNIAKRIFPIICEITGTSIFVIPFGMFLAKYTDVCHYIGAIFLPLLHLVGIDTSSAKICSQSLAVSILEPVLAGAMAEGADISILARWVIAIVPYSAIIFFAGFIPSLWKSGIHCKIHEMLVIWVERVFIGIILSALLGHLLILAGLI